MSGTTRRSRLPALMLAVVLAAIAACVTINVYFPAAEVQRAADRLIDEVWGKDAQGGASGSPPAQGKPSSRWEGGISALALGWLERLIPAAGAQANIDVSSPGIEKLKQSMQARHAMLAPYYDRGAIGLTEDGLITEHDRKAIPLQARQQVIALIAAENRDRKALYREIARENGHPEWERQVQSTFAERWISKARRGWWYRTAQGWRQR